MLQFPSFQVLIYFPMELVGLLEIPIFITPGAREAETRFTMGEGHRVHRESNEKFGKNMAIKIMENIPTPNLSEKEKFSSQNLFLAYLPTDN